MPMQMILFNNALVKTKLKANNIAVMTQNVGGKAMMAAPDTPEVWDIINSIKEQFDRSEFMISDRLCF